MCECENVNEYCRQAHRTGDSLKRKSESDGCPQKEAKRIVYIHSRKKQERKERRKEILAETEANWHGKLRWMEWNLGFRTWCG